MATATASMNTPAMALPGNETGASDATPPSNARLPGQVASAALKPGELAKGVANQALTDPMGMVRDMMRQPTVRKVLPVLIILLVVAAFGLASLSMKTPSYRPLTMMLSEADKQLALEALRGADFKPEIDAATGQITGRNPFLKSLIMSCFLLSRRARYIKSASLARSEVCMVMLIMGNLIHLLPSLIFAPKNKV